METKITEQEFADGWKHFCKCINWAQSALDAEAIQFMNEVPGKVLAVLDTAPKLLQACKGAAESITNAFEIMDRAVESDNWDAAEIWLNNSRSNLQAAIAKAEAEN